MEGDWCQSKANGKEQIIWEDALLRHAMRWVFSNIYIMYLHLFSNAKEKHHGRLQVEDDQKNVVLFCPALEIDLGAL
eukprot:15353566-Ditylum_brightwellii.AAC.2